jgi:hypothetical protein
MKQKERVANKQPNVVLVLPSFPFPPTLEMLMNKDMPKRQAVRRRSGGHR